MPDANAEVSVKKKGLTLGWVIALVLFALFFLFAIAAPKFGRFQARPASEVRTNMVPIGAVDPVQAIDREKRNPKEPEIIQTLHGVGYRHLD